MLKKLSIYLLCLIPSGVVWSASFDCNVANKTNIETVICNSNLLSSLDENMAEVYFHLLNTKGVNKTELRHTQRQWLKSRNECFVAKSGVQTPEGECLQALYEQRIAWILAHRMYGSDLPD